MDKYPRPYNKINELSDHSEAKSKVLEEVLKDLRIYEFSTDEALIES